MKKLQIDQRTSQQAEADSRRNRPMLGILVLCLLLCFGIVVSLAFLGSSIGQFSKKDANVIPLIPTEEISLNAGGNKMAGLSFYEAEQIPDEKTSTASRETSSQQASGNTGYTAGQSVGNHGELQVFDDVQAWSSETHVDLFRESYNDTVKSENGKNVIAPGTSNFYQFTVKNNGNIPLDYSVSLEVDTYLGEGENYSALPLEWRLLSGDGSAISDWKEYNERTEVLKSSTLAVRNQDNYTIEWRWAFERGENMDGADTDMGNIAVNQPLGVNAAIYIYAEQGAGSDSNLPGSDSDGNLPGSDSDGNLPGAGSDSNLPGSDSDGNLPGSEGIPKTGDASNTALYIVLMALSICGLVILFVINRRRKNDGDA